MAKCIRTWAGGGWPAPHGGVAAGGEGAPRGLRERWRSVAARVGPRCVAAVAAASGVAVPVAALFTPLGLAFARDTTDPGALAIVALATAGLPALAAVCTALTVHAASGRRSLAGAVGLAAVGMIAPPTLLFAPTVFGLYFAVPAGVVAFVLTLPVVLLARARELRRVGPASGDVGPGPAAAPRTGTTDPR